MNFTNKNNYRTLSLLVILFVFYNNGFSFQNTNDTIILTLDEAKQMAFDKNPSLRASELGTRAAQYQLDETRGNLLPHFDIGGTYTKNIKLPVMYFPGIDIPGMPPMEGGYIEVGRPHNYRATLSGMMPLYSPALYANIRANRIEIDKAREEFRGSKIELGFEVKQAYFNALLAKESKEVMQLSFENAMENLDFTKKMYSQGLVSEYDKIRAEVQTENIKPDVMEIENSYKMALNYLKTVIGMDKDKPIKLDGNLLDAVDLYFSQFQILEPESKLAKNPDLRQLDLNMSMMEQQSKAIKASALPSVFAIGNYNYQTDAEDLSISDYEWAESLSAGLQISIPIFQGFMVRNRAKQIDVAVKQMRYQKEYLEDNLKMQLDNIIKSLDVAVTKSTKAERNVKLAERGHEIAKTRYASGQGSLLEVNDSELELTRARFNLLQAKYEILNAIIEYDKFVGNEY